jgi:hypothetical protein
VPEKTGNGRSEPVSQHKRPEKAACGNLLSWGGQGFSRAERAAKNAGFSLR